ncbi:hypothetical protein KKE14_02995 [Patescibacteria group bacterium]|nr:hypothetical protein [Patescibacteria group bacterium]
MVGDFDEQSDDYIPSEDESSDDEDRSKNKEGSRPRKAAGNLASNIADRAIQAGVKAGVSSNPALDAAAWEASERAARWAGRRLAKTRAGKAVLRKTKPVTDAIARKTKPITDAVSRKAKPVTDALKGARKVALRKTKPITDALKGAGDFALKKTKPITDATSKLTNTSKLTKPVTKVTPKMAKPLDKFSKAASRIDKSSKVASKLAKVKPAGTITKQAKVIGNVAKPLAKFAPKILPKILAGAAKVVPYILPAVIAMGVYTMYTGGRNKINSLMGGSIFMAPDYESQADRDLVTALSIRAGGSGADPHVLKILSPGGISPVNLTQFDIEWKCDESGQNCTHLLDIRILRTLKYLTDKHEYVEISMLKTGAPTLLRESVKVRKAQEAMEGVEVEDDERFAKESYSAFYLGQGMAIKAVDYSKIPDLPPNTPIEVYWQETAMERVTRPIWEELEFTAGYLDGELGAFIEGYNTDLGSYEVQNMVDAYRFSVSENYAMDIYYGSFEKLNRIIELLKRLLDADQGGYTTSSSKKDILDGRTVGYAQRALDAFEEVSMSLGTTDNEDDGALAQTLRSFGAGTNIKLWKEGIRYTYKATQVANMVGWNERGASNLKWNKAYEARNKIRQVIKELLEMPKENISSNSLPPEETDGTDFDGFMVIKQVITFSPEDDLDNGLMDLDVFPKGITAVGVGGVAIEGIGTATVQDESGEFIVDATIGDGNIDDADRHFSYKPIDNGVFAKNGTNYIWVFDPDVIGEKDKVLAFATAFTSTLKNLAAEIYYPLHNYFTGGEGCVFDPGFEECRMASYKHFIQVSF